MNQGPFNIVKNKKDVVSNFYGIFMNQFAYVIGILTSFFNIPQIVQIWLYKNASGVSLFSWIGFFLGSLFWLLYSIHHKEKALVFTFALTLLFQFFIITGVIIYN